VKEKEKSPPKDKGAQESEIMKPKAKEVPKPQEVDILSFNNFSETSTDTGDSFHQFFTETSESQSQSQSQFSRPVVPQASTSTHSKPAPDIMSLFGPPAPTPVPTSYGYGPRPINPPASFQPYPSPVSFPMPGYMSHAPLTNPQIMQQGMVPKKKAITTSDLLSLY